MRLGYFVHRNGAEEIGVINIDSIHNSTLSFERNVGVVASFITRTPFCPIYANSAVNLGKTKYYSDWQNGKLATL